MKDVFLFISAKLIEGCYPDNQRRKENLPNEPADADLPTGTWPTSSNEGAGLTPAALQEEARKWIPHALSISNTMTCFGNHRL